MAREIVDPRSGNVAQRIEAAEPRQIAPGVWAPKSLRNLLFDPTSKRLTVDSQLLMREVTVNGTRPAKLFEFEPKPGSIELKRGRFDQCISGGLDFLDETATRLQQFRRYGGPPSSSGARTAVTLAIIGVLIAFGVTMTLQAMKHPTSILAKLRSRPD